MSQSIRPAYSLWPRYNNRLRDTVTAMTPAQLAIEPEPDRWPLWATVGHLACQRVFWLCDVAGMPGAETTPFTRAAWDCPGDDDLEHVLSPDQLSSALDATFVIVERCLDTWTLDMLGEEIRHPEWEDFGTRLRGSILQRTFTHDIAHVAELNEALGRAGLATVNLWD
jgi:DinB superfamily